MVDLPKADLPRGHPSHGRLRFRPWLRPSSGILPSKDRLKLAQAVLEMDNVVDRMKDEGLHCPGEIHERTSGDHPGRRWTRYLVGPAISNELADHATNIARKTVNLLGARGRRPAQCGSRTTLSIRKLRILIKALLLNASEPSGSCGLPRTSAPKGRPIVSPAVLSLRNLRTQFRPRWDD